MVSKLGEPVTRTDPGLRAEGAQANGPAEAATLANAETVLLVTNQGEGQGRTPSPSWVGDALRTPFPNVRYTADAKLGEGGMGEVVLHADHWIGREVATKFIRPDGGGSPDARDRFFREAWVQGQLEHPSIVPVYDIGTRGDGAPYFTMKRVRGTTLQEVIERPKGGGAKDDWEFSRFRLLTAFSKVCRAVHYAHARGVLHRDLKPGNIMLGSFGEVYVLDWGIAKLAGIGVSDKSTAAGGRTAAHPVLEVGNGKGALTDAGEVMGTLGYMAPEQARGDGAALGPRTDVYALGLILFEILARSPLHADQSRESSLESTLKGVDVTAEFKRRGVRAPPKLEALCVRATAADPSTRYGSAGELEEALMAYLEEDRNLERRRELANRSADDAKRLADKALAPNGGTEDRTLALAAVGRALALAPDNETARSTLLRLLTEIPREMPAEVVATLEKEASIQRKHFALILGVFYLVFGLFGIHAAFALMTEIPKRFVAVCLVMVVLSAGSLVSIARGKHTTPRLLFALAACTAAMATSAWGFGFLIFFPPLNLGNMTSSRASPRWRPRCARGWTPPRRG